MPHTLPFYYCFLFCCCCYVFRLRRQPTEEMDETMRWDIKIEMMRHLNRWIKSQRHVHWRHTWGCQAGMGEMSLFLPGVMVKVEQRKEPPPAAAATCLSTVQLSTSHPPQLSAQQTRLFFPVTVSPALLPPPCPPHLPEKVRQHICLKIEEDSK